jgi:uncharacterized phiE125 gp8 family phage protein
MSLILLSSPALEPVSIKEAKVHARITSSGGPTVSITSISRASGVVTVDAIAHGLSQGDSAIIGSVLDGSFNGVFEVSSVPDADHLQFAQDGIDATSSGGTIGEAGLDDATVSDLITAARVSLEDYTRTVFITQKWQYKRDGFPGYHALYEREGYPLFYVPKPPFQAVTLFQYADTGGSFQDLVAADSSGNTTDGNQYGYQVDPGGGSKSARLFPAYAAPWPPTRLIPGNVVLEFDCGYGDSGKAVPGTIRLAIKKTFSDWFYNRERVEQVPDEIMGMLENYRNLLS